MARRERRQADLLHPCSGAADGVEHAHQRMGGTNFVVAVGTDQQKVLPVRPGQQILEQIQRRRVEPLQIVEKQSERMLRPGKHADEALPDQLESPSRVLWRQLRHRRLLAGDKPQLRDEIDNELCVRAERLPQRIAPTAQLGVAGGEKRPDQALKSLRNRRIRDVTPVLVELAGGEKAARHQRLVQLVDDRGLADAGEARDKHQFRRAARGDTIEGSEQRFNVALSAVQFLGDPKPVRYIAFAEAKVIDVTVLPPRGQAAPQIMLQARRGLVSVLRRLGEQLHDDR